MNDYSLFIDCLHNQANIKEEHYEGTCMPLRDLADACKITTAQAEEYLKQYQNENDKFEYHLSTVAWGGRGEDMCEYYFNY